MQEIHNSLILKMTLSRCKLPADLFSLLMQHSPMLFGHITTCIYSDIQLPHLNAACSSLFFFFLQRKHLRMLPGATDLSDLYSTQLSKRTPCRVLVNFKRIEEKVEQNGERYFLCYQQVG